jgi:hypothetical protein
MDTQMTRFVLEVRPGWPGCTVPHIIVGEI